MNTYVVWLEMDMARIFKVQTGGPRLKIIHRKEMKHHTHADPKNHKDCEHLFQQVAHEIHDADEIMLVGAGLAKKHFQSHLQRTHQGALLSKVVGSVTADRITDPEILDLSRRFFRQRAVFESAIQ